MKVEILYLSGCFHYPEAVRRVQDVLHQEGIPADIVEVEVTDLESALSLGFLGSPTIRVEGEDVEHAARKLAAFGMSCRTYVEGGMRSGVPPREWIRAALQEAIGNQGN